MAEQATLVKNGVDRFQSAFRSIDQEVQRLQKQLRTRRRSIEKRTQKQVDRVLGEIRKNSFAKRARALRVDAVRQIENSVGNVLGVLSIASKNDIHRIDRKLTQLNRKLRDIEKTKGSNSEAA